MKKKILFLTSSLNGGGAEKVLVDILRNLDGEKYDITVLSIFNEGVYIRQLPPYVKYKSLKMTFWYSFFWRALKYLPRRWCYKFFIRGKYDVEIAFLEGLSTMLLSGSTCKNTVAWVHTDLVDNDFISQYHRGDSHIFENYSKYSHVVFVSNRAKEQFETRFGSLASGTVIYNLIDKNVIAERCKEFLPAENPQVPVVCTVGRLIPVKGFFRLLSAHKKLIDGGIFHKLWILGIGAEEENLKTFVRENGLEDSVTFWGFQSNPYPYVERCDIYVCSSFAEGYPLSVAEALVLQKTIVATKCTGPTEILRGGEYGLLCENSEEGIYQGLQSLLTAPALLREFQQKAALGARTVDPEGVIKQIEALF